MSLYQRLNDTGEGGALPSQPVANRNPVLRDIRMRVHRRLIDHLGPVLYDSRLSESELRTRVYSELQKALSAEDTPLSAVDREAVTQAVSDDVLGYGPITGLLHDEAVDEIMCNGPHLIYSERGGKLHREDVSFGDEGHLRRVIDKIVAQVGRRIDESSPLCDARLPDGSRVNAVVAPLAVGGPFLTIRKFAADPYRIDDLIRFRTVSVQAARFLQGAVAGRLNILVSGGTGSGKTTTLNVLSSFIPDNERIVTVEDAKELQLLQEHVLSMETRLPNIEGKGEVTVRDLVRNSLRMRPDRIVVGECRAGEALDMLQAMNTGHDGSLTTLHANTPRDALSRLETLVLMAGYELPVKAIREQTSAAIDLIVQLQRLRDGTRRVTHITEVMGMEQDIVTLQDIYTFNFGAGVDENGLFRGELTPTGIRPSFTQRLADQGIRMGPEMFSTTMPRGPQ